LSRSGLLYLGKKSAEGAIPLRQGVLGHDLNADLLQVEQ
jgi:hypothetical protein